MRSPFDLRKMSMAVFQVVVLIRSEEGNRGVIQLIAVQVPADAIQHMRQVTRVLGVGDQVVRVELAGWRNASVNLRSNNSRSVSRFAAR